MEKDGKKNSMKSTIIIGVILILVVSCLFYIFKSFSWFFQQKNIELFHIITFILAGMGVSIASIRYAQTQKQINNAQEIGRQARLNELYTKTIEPIPDRKIKIYKLFVNAISNILREDSKTHKKHAQRYLNFLGGIIVTGTDLSGIDLQYAQLQNSVLEEVNLHGANLKSTRISKKAITEDGEIDNKAHIAAYKDSIIGYDKISWRYPPII